MTIDQLLHDAGNYPYQRERADAYFRILVALLLTNGPARIHAAERALALGPLDEFELTVHDDPTTGDLILTVVRP